MGCGQSKINIYPRRSKGKNSSKTSVADKIESEEEEGAENEQDANPNLEECNTKKKPSRTKPIGNSGGPLLAQTELSSSQQNFFKMLDEKIENGPDYDSNDETEIALETARLHSLLRDWETASASSRSLPSTPRHTSRGATTERPNQHTPKSHNKIPANVIHQTYGVSTPYRHVNYNPTHQPHNPNHQTQQATKMPYQEFNATYKQAGYSTTRQYTYTMPTNIPTTVPSGSPTHYATNSPKHKYPTPQTHTNVNPILGYVPVQNSPTHKLYITSQNQNYTNGELIIQQQLYNQQIQYHQAREYQQFRQTREQLLVQQMCGSATSQPVRGPHYQSNIHVPIVGVMPQVEQSPKMSPQRKQRHYSQEMT